MTEAIDDLRLLNLYHGFGVTPFTTAEAFARLRRRLSLPDPPGGLILMGRWLGARTRSPGRYTVRRFQSTRPNGKGAGATYWQIIRDEYTGAPYER